jgi:hypothetical protein
LAHPIVTPEGDAWFTRFRNRESGASHVEGLEPSVGWGVPRDDLVGGGAVAAGDGVGDGLGDGLGDGSEVDRGVGLSDGRGRKVGDAVGSTVGDGVILGVGLDVTIGESGSALSVTVMSTKTTAPNR